jgi:hypothetical protein
LCEERKIVEWGYCARSAPRAELSGFSGCLLL